MNIKKIFIVDQKNTLLKPLLVLLFLIIISLILSIWKPLIFSFRVVFGSFYFLFLPGLVLSFSFFNKEEIDIIERIALSFALSISVIPLFVFYLNLAGIKINLLNVFLITTAIIILGLILLWTKRKTA